ncbi:hypothetical protein NKZ35_25320 [Sinorhizobium meliloti]|uniref:hypothetical protein n=1 Tax=Rhizobium meliloti TaxID=382 RepID=UPI003D65BCCB
MLADPDVNDKLETLSDQQLVRLRARIHREMKRRKLPVTVGSVAERLAIDYFNTSRGCPNLQEAPPGTSNVDALSRKGERYSIKAIQQGRKTGTIYPDRDDPGKQLFEYLLVVRMDEDWGLQAIYELDWALFVKLRSWDIRMNAWYVGGSARTLAQARVYTPSD